MLTDEDLDRIADRFVERFGPRPDPLVSAAELAELLGVSADFAYRHRHELGMVMVGRALRFDVNRARRLLDERTARLLAPPKPKVITPRARRRRQVA